MTSDHLDYDKIASSYNRRYKADTTEGIGQALARVVSELAPTRVLEVGCGTGHWLGRFAPLMSELYGLDFSAGMLEEARRRDAPLHLTQGVARHLPFPSDSLDLVFCVNALHHFSDPQGFIAEAYRLLHPGGILAIVGQDPHGRRESWYVYTYFEGVYDRDLARFPTWATVLEWMAAAGFEATACEEVEHIHEEKLGRAVLTDPFLEKGSCSQLALLSDAAYATGLARIKSALAVAEAEGESLRFESDIVLAMLSGRKEDSAATAL